MVVVLKKALDEQDFSQADVLHLHVLPASILLQKNTHLARFTSSALSDAISRM